MLYIEVTPLSDIEGGHKVDRRGGARANNRDPFPAYTAKHNQAVAKYRKVMGIEWTPTATIERRLGIGRTASTNTLRAYHKKGLLEKRKIGGDDNWSRRIGYEWRFVK